MVKLKSNGITKTGNDYFNCHSYLERFWPKTARGSKVWPENRWLLSQYLSIVKRLSSLYNARFNNLDISTGPTLAPTLAFSPILDDLQLSDYSETCRKILTTLKVDYWIEYAREVIKMEGLSASEESIRERLSTLDLLRSKHPVIKVDLKSRTIFIPNVDCSKFNLFTMHFVADSITSSKEEYFEILSRVLRLLKLRDILVLSALTESTVWDDGIEEYPSPNVSVQEIETFLVKHTFKKICVGRSNFKNNEGHDGNSATFCFAKT